MLLESHTTMTKQLILLVFMFLFVFSFSGAVESGFYLGGGFSSVKLDSDHPSINDQNDTAYYLLVGSRSEKWGFELATTGGMSFSTGETPGIYYPADSAEYGILDIGIKRFFNPEVSPKLYPWLGVGLGLHFISWNTYYYNVDGYGYSLNGGVDYQLEPHWLVRGGVIYHDFESDDTYDYGPYDGKTTQVNLAVLYLF